MRPTLSLRTEVRPTQQQILTARLTQQQILTVRLLSLPGPRLAEEIEDAIAENECVERVDGPPADLADATTGAPARERFGTEDDHYRERDPYDRLFGSNERTPVSTEEREPHPSEDIRGLPSSLPDVLLRQLRIATNDDGVRAIGEAIIWNLDDSGYLRAGLEEIAAAAGASVADVERTLTLVQGFEPTGVGARDPRECLLLQLRADPQADSVALEIVEQHFDALCRHRLDHLAHVLQLSTDRILTALQAIRRLDPKPGRQFGAEDARSVRPEITIEKIAGDYVVTLNDQGLPLVRVARGYERLWHRLDADARRFVSERRQAARWLVEAIEQRRRTLILVAESVVRFQRDFLDSGPAHLRPLSLRHVADEISMHESTVSRATSAKFVDTPHGVLPFKYFFQPGVPSSDGALASAVAAKQSLKALIAEEDGSHPLSDRALSSALRHHGFALARRTVAKYRDELAIAPCHERRRLRAASLN